MPQEDIRMWTVDELIAELIRRHEVKIEVVVEQLKSVVSPDITEDHISFLNSKFKVNSNFT